MIFPSALEEYKDAEAMVTAMEWKAFLDIDWEMVYAGMNKPLLYLAGTTGG